MSLFSIVFVFSYNVVDSMQCRGAESATENLFASTFTKSATDVRSSDTRTSVTGCINEGVKTTKSNMRNVRSDHIDQRQTHPLGHRHQFDSGRRSLC